MGARQADLGIYSQRQTDAHHRALTNQQHWQNKSHLTHLRRHHLQQISLKWEASDCILISSYLSVCVSGCCLTTLDDFFHTRSTPAPSCSLSLRAFHPLLFFSSIFFWSMANLSWTFLRQRGAILHCDMTWSKRHFPHSLHQNTVTLILHMQYVILNMAKEWLH